MQIEDWVLNMEMLTCNVWTGIENAVQLQSLTVEPADIWRILFSKSSLFFCRNSKYNSFSLLAGSSGAGLVVFSTLAGFGAGYDRKKGKKNPVLDTHVQS